MVLSNIGKPYYQKTVSESNIDGEKLFRCNSEEDVQKLLSTWTFDRMILYHRLKRFRDEGVPLYMLVPSGTLYRKLSCIAYFI